ncbi:DUF4238 domain-containing protein [Mycobacterium sherrisii]|uniref:DUF4238 domain-containing protein n=1 Tax=Mycobacterium sherrisii TaxID=243061 RepID=UPI002DDD7466|nr:DUF4238 domain-containing protein [Mycobacterium sherrisii]MEC4763826.1 DUF4238 domain-containing protein [Mycobacterium sherrisii]
MGDVAKLHHTVPQFYLRGFADTSERITTVKLPGEKRYTQVVKKTAATNHFYSIDGHPQGSDVFEKSLSDMEADAALVFDTIKGGTWPLSEEQRGTLATFMAVQRVRGPDHRRTMGYLAATMTQLEVQVTGRENIQQWVKDRYGVEVDDDEAQEVWEQATQPGGPPITVAPQEHIAQLVHSAENILPFIVGRPWTLVRFRRRSLVTSDLPVALLPHPDDDPSRGVGFLTALNITFPLTRRLGLMMGDLRKLAEANIPVEVVHAGGGDGVEDGTTHLARLFNSLTVGSAAEYIYHHPDDDGVLPSPLPEPRESNIWTPGLDDFGADQ